MVPKSAEWWQGIWNINFFCHSLKITSDILRYIRYSALQCHLAAAFCFIINVAWFIFIDLSSDAWTFSCLYCKRYIIYGQNSQSQDFQQNNLLKSCIGSLVESENCNRTASPPDLAHCAPPSTQNVHLNHSQGRKNSPSFWKVILYIFSENLQNNDNNNGRKPAISFLDWKRPHPFPPLELFR